MKHNPNNEQYARQLRKNMTPWERKLWYRFLKDYPIRFQRQKCIDNYIADFYCFRAKLIIELDGGGHYETESERKDAIRTQKLESYGLKVIRFCNLDIDKNFYGVCTVIDHEVNNRI
jgi:very-short-patch-repair endonuclease